MNILEFLKNGSGIHIKKKNRGKFTDYCGGKVTSACIAKGKSSSNPAIRKRATFAANARKWKHKEGGFLKSAYEIRKALEGTKFDWQTFATDIGTNLLQAMSDNNKASSELQAQLALNSLDYASTMENLARLNRLENENRFLKWLNDYLSGRILDLPSNIVNNSMGYAGFSRSLALENLKLLNKNKQALFDANLKMYSGWGNALSGIIMSGLQAKKRRGTVEVGSPQAVSVEKVG